MACKQPIWVKNVNIFQKLNEDNSKCCIIGNQTCFSFLKTFRLIQEASSVLTNWRGVCRLNKDKEALKTVTVATFPLPVNFDVNIQVTSICQKTIQ